jgi:hypothetical protein
LLPNPRTLHSMDCIGTTVLPITKFFRSLSFPGAGVGRCASKDKKYAGDKTTTIVAPDGPIEDCVIGSAAPHDVPYGEALRERTREWYVLRRQRLYRRSRR